MGPRKREGDNDAAAVTGGLKLIRSDEETTENVHKNDGASPDLLIEKPGSQGPDGADTQDEARRLAREAVWRNACKLVNELINKPGGNYLAVKFLFDFAGLITAEEPHGATGDLKSFMQDLLNRPKTGVAKQTTDAKLNLSTSDGTDNGRS